MPGRWLKNEKGQAIVESALVLPIILLLLLGMVEMGRMGNAYLTVTNAARHGARLGAVGGSNVEITERVLSSATALDPATLAVEIYPENQRQSGQDIKVTVSYPLDLILPLPTSILEGPVLVSSDTTMRIE
ncbi:TadE/TadG family type IV pilus assembly protein [Dethiobacter alkaliphilus]|uniref:TadE/TadG family type IV pilus assembly protein n=1 Tax=Dethiobacter alkaliphilus TaxID=427926 RepID=UPI0022267667|nr:TadE family protein [Dethiobacter alkaliphilus]MCW3489628.1 pilus assembly protein [Dethiobacter alkaliphilus]